MLPGKRKRKVLLLLAILLAGAAVLLLGLPAWLPWVLRPLAASQGASYARYERDGYTRFVLSEATYTNQGITFRAKRLEALVPTVWLWRLATSRHGGEEPFARAADVTLISIPTRKVPPGVSSESRKANRTLHGLAFWMPAAGISNGTLRLNQETLRFPDLLWSNGVILGTVQSPRLPASLAVRAHRAGPAGYVLEASSEALHLFSRVHAFTNDVGLALESTHFWRSNRVDAQAQFGPTGTLPTSASVLAPDVKLPTESLGLPLYEELRGSLAAKWEGMAFALDLLARAESPPASTNVPPLELDLHARGDTNAAIIETATVVSPAVKAQLSRELTVYFSGQMLRQPARLALDADLSRQSWLPLRGKLQGEALLSPGAGKYPEARFQLTGLEVGYDFLQTRSFEAGGTFEWPRLEISRATAVLEDGASGALSGALDLAKKTVIGGRVEASGPLPRRWLPAGYGYDALSVTGQVSGPFERLAHAGDLAIAGARTPYLKPLDIRARWHGERAALDHLQLMLSNKVDWVSLTGALDASPQRADLKLEQLSFQTNGQPCLRLAQPAHLSASRSGRGQPWHMASSPLLLGGPGGEARLEGALEWPHQANLQLGLRRFSPIIFEELLQPELPDIHVDRLEAAAAWTNGPARFEITFSGDTAPPGKLGTSSRIAVELAATTGPGGLVVSNLVLTSHTAVVARASGVLPLSVSPSLGTNLVLLRTNLPLRFTARTEPRSIFWEELSRYTGVLLREPHLEAELSGTWDDPQGKVIAGAGALMLSNQTSRPYPNVENLQLVLELGRREARLTTGRLLVQSQPVNFAAQMPLGEGAWPGLLHGKWPGWENVGGRLQIEDAAIAAFQSFLPAVLAPQGELSVDLIVHPGKNLGGELSIAHAQTRPLGPTGPLRNIFVNVTLQGDWLLLERASANVGAATVNLAGRADLTGTQWWKGELPPFNVSLHGRGVPLARQPEAVIRSDLLLAITKTNGAPPLISGSAQLHDSYFLSDLSDLVPGGVASPEKRPPYFSVREPFLADWRLGVDVSGPRFLKLRSPLFNGEITANLKLQGTLKDPIALGDLKIESGVVRFPFASLQVQQGLVSLTSQDPFHPQLAINAASKQFGYDIRMNVSGPVDAPIIQFSSSPPLSSEQILLMVSAGELPQGTFSLTPQQRAQTVAMFLGRDLLSKIGVGDEAQQRLSIRSGEQISEQGRPTYQVEYKLTDRWSITGEYDRFGDYNAGVKWRVYSK